MKLKGLASLLILFAVEAAFLWPLLSTADRLPPEPPSDLHAQILQRVVWAREFFIKYGTIPLWDSFMYAGTPLVGKMQSPIFYPLNWFAPLVPVVVFVNLFFVAQSVLSSLFTYLLVRRWKLSRAAALIAAFSYGLGGTLIARSAYAGQMMHVGNWPWLPLVLLLADALAEKPTAARAALMGLAWAIQFQAGHPQFFLYSSTLVGAYMIYMIFTRPRPERLRLVLWYGFAGVVLVGASCIMLLPALEYNRLMPNGGETDFDYTQTFSMTLEHVARLFYGRRPGYASMTNADFWESCGYSGLVAIALGIAAIGLKGLKGRAGFFGLSAVVSVLFGMGATGGVFYLFYYLVPGFKLFRIPPRDMIVFNMCVAILAAIGYDALASALPHERRRVARRALAALGAAAAAYALPFWVIKVAGDEPAWAFKQWQTLTVLGMALAAPLLAGLRGGKLAAAVAVLAIAADLALFDLPLIQTEPAALSFWKSKLVDTMAADRQPFRVLRRTQSLRLSHLTAAGLEPVSSFVDVNTLASYEDMVLGHKERFEEFPSDLKLLNIKYVVTAGARDLPGFDLVDVEANSFTGALPNHLYRFRDFLPRAHIVWEEKALDSGAPLVSQLKLIDPAREALVEKVRLGDGPSGELAVSITDYRPGRMRIRVTGRTGRTALLVFSENFHPGWRLCEIPGGRPIPLLKVNGGQLGCYIDRPREAQLEYFPNTYVVGRAITALTLAVCAIIFAISAYLWIRDRKLGLESNARSIVGQTFLSGN